MALSRRTTERSVTATTCGARRRDTVGKGILWSLLIMGGLMLWLSFYVNSVALIYLEILLGMVIMGPIIFYFGGRMSTKMNMAHQGYDVDWSPDREKIIGTDTYHILRADPGHLQGMIMGFNGNPFATSKRTLQDLESKQREDAECDECGTELFEGRALDQTGAYFVEERKRYWIFGVPIREKVLGWDTYCAAHKPEEGEYE